MSDNLKPASDLIARRHRERLIREATSLAQRADLALREARDVRDSGDALTLASRVMNLSTTLGQVITEAAALGGALELAEVVADDPNG